MPLIKPKITVSNDSVTFNSKKSNQTDMHNLVIIFAKNRAEPTRARS